MTGATRTKPSEAQRLVLAALVEPGHQLLYWPVGRSVVAVTDDRGHYVKTAIDDPVHGGFPLATLHALQRHGWVAERKGDAFGPRHLEITEAGRAVVATFPPQRRASDA